MLVSAVVTARDFVQSARQDDGSYRLNDWPQVRTRRGRGLNPRKAVTRLRVAQRLLMGFLDPVEDALFLTAGLRRLGVRSLFQLGRELAPGMGPAGFYAWVECAGEVVSTSLPVHEEYIVVHRSAEG
ncbi:hypothetical protein Rhe02_69760 [Rhizocola hellebori]|uniref:Microcin J25-processing protein McjB C-terminal domain-containing protein n=1 Tax=Rhizocola hellebori TaxID=1392758 RepID=A0A8J3QDS0_9ACTN|nr:lasso peptide biosynthesis protein [Rhizocola hellebori]GIH08909.1 hypothetical protein Rhe02_69760 [Rhizocola hellebori]